jgi:hypothetical protein
LPKGQPPPLIPAGATVTDKGAHWYLQHHLRLLLLPRHLPLLLHRAHLPRRLHHHPCLPLLRARRPRRRLRRHHLRRRRPHVRPALPLLEGEREGEGERDRERERGTALLLLVASQQHGLARESGTAVHTLRGLVERLARSKGQTSLAASSCQSAVWHSPTHHDESCVLVVAAVGHILLATRVHPNIPRRGVGLQRTAPPAFVHPNH